MNLVQRFGRNRVEWFVVILGVLGIFTLLGLVSPSRGVPWNYLTSVLIIMAIYALFALGLSLIFGYTGLLNFGHVGFMAIGAYTVAIIPMRYGATWGPALTGATVPGFLVTALAGIVAGLLVLVPLMLLAATALRRMQSRTRLLIAVVPAALVALVVTASLFPLSPHGALNGVVFLAVLAGMALAALVGLMLGLPAVRLRADYLAITTLAAAEVVRFIALNEGWLTRGSQGIQRLQRPFVDWALGTPWWREFAAQLTIRPVGLVHAVVGVLAVLFVFMLLETLARSPWGRVLKAIREDEEVALAVGKNVLFYKLQALMIGSAIAALSGMLLVWHLSNVVPEHFLPLVTFFAFIILIIGGAGNHKGALLGAAVLWGLFEMAGQLTVLDRYGLSFSFAGPVQSLFVGVVLVLFMLFRPQGILGRKEEMALAK